MTMRLSRPVQTPELPDPTHLVFREAGEVYQVPRDDYCHDVTSGDNYLNGNRFLGQLAFDVRIPTVLGATADPDVGKRVDYHYKTNPRFNPSLWDRIRYGKNASLGFSISDEIHTTLSSLSKVLFLDRVNEEVPIPDVVDATVADISERFPYDGTPDNDVSDNWSRWFPPGHEMRVVVGSTILELSKLAAVRAGVRHDRNISDWDNDWKTYYSVAPEDRPDFLDIQPYELASIVQEDQI